MTAHQAQFPIRTMAHVLRVSASGFYAWRQRQPSARVLSGFAPKVSGCCCMGCGSSGGFQDGQHCHAPAEEAQPATVGRNVLVVAGAGTEEVAQLVMASTEPGG